MRWQMEMDSPVGVLEITANETAIMEILFLDKTITTKVYEPGMPAVLKQCRDELTGYFNGERENFTVAMKPIGTDFQKQVWQALCEIPCGEVRTYREIAISLGNEKAARAVGAANGKNQLNILVPCHRLVGSNEKLTGYGGGIWRKQWLLTHEKKK